ncbi:hypothetical protein LINGRAPRIM_LOCUS1476 [Linum grandiflorum]
MASLGHCTSLYQSLMQEQNPALLLTLRLKLRAT